MQSYHNDRTLKILYDPQNNNSELDIEQVGVQEYIEIQEVSFDADDNNSVFVSQDTGNDSTGDGTQSTPYKTLLKAIENLTELKSAVVVLDSASYHEDFSSITSDYLAGIFCKAGETPEYCPHDYDITHSDANTLYVSKSAGDDDTGTGTSASPVKTIAKALTLVDSHTHIMITDDEEYDEAIYNTGNITIRAEIGKKPTFTFPANESSITEDSFSYSGNIPDYPGKPSGTIQVPDAVLPLSNGNYVKRVKAYADYGHYLFLVDNNGNEFDNDYTYADFPASIRYIAMVQNPVTGHIVYVYQRCDAFSIGTSPFLYKVYSEDLTILTGESTLYTPSGFQQEPNTFDRLEFFGDGKMLLAVIESGVQKLMIYDTDFTLDAIVTGKPSTIYFNSDGFRRVGSGDIVFNANNTEGGHLYFLSSDGTWSDLFISNSYIEHVECFWDTPRLYAKFLHNRSVNIEEDRTIIFARVIYKIEGWSGMANCAVFLTISNQNTLLEVITHEEIMGNFDAQGNTLFPLQDGYLWGNGRFCTGTEYSYESRLYFLSSDLKSYVLLFAQNSSGSQPTPYWYVGDWRMGSITDERKVIFENSFVTDSYATFSQPSLWFGEFEFLPIDMSANLTLQNLCIDLEGQLPADQLIKLNGFSLAMKNCKVSSSQTPVIYGTGSVNIQNCLFDDNAEILDTTCNTLNIEGNIFQDGSKCVINNSGSGTGIVINHNTFFKNYSVLSLSGNAGSEVVKNCIFHLNNNADVLTTAITITGTVITDDLGYLVLGDDTSTYNPLFQEEEFYGLHLKTRLLSYYIDSPAKALADDGFDSGAYKTFMCFSQMGWATAEVVKPEDIDVGIEPVNAVENIKENGDISTSVSAFLEVVTLSYKGIAKEDWDKFALILATRNPTVRMYLDPVTNPTVYDTYKIRYKSYRGSPGHFRGGNVAVTGFDITFSRQYTA